MANGHIVVPRLLYFESGNIYSGSVGKFNFKIFPSGETMKAKVWYGMICITLAQITAEEEFPVTEEGRSAMIQWLEEEYRKFLQSGGDLTN